MQLKSTNYAGTSIPNHKEVLNNAATTIQRFARAQAIVRLNNTQITQIFSEPARTQHLQEIELQEFNALAANAPGERQVGHIIEMGENDFVQPQAIAANPDPITNTEIIRHTLARLIHNTGAVGIVAPIYFYSVCFAILILYGASTTNGEEIGNNNDVVEPESGESDPEFIRIISQIIHPMYGFGVAGLSVLGFLFSYILHPRANQRTIRQRPPLINPAGETERPHRYPTHASDSIISRDVKVIQDNLTKALENTPLITTEETRIALDNLFNSGTLSSNIRYKNRLTAMISSNGQDKVALIWTFIQKTKDGIEKERLSHQFIEHLAKTEGCPDGRENQILSFFISGIDSSIFKIKPLFEATITRIPESKEKKIELLALLTSAMQAAYNNKDLSLTSPEEDERAFLSKIFVHGDHYVHFMTDVSMSERVLNELFSEMQNTLLGI